MKKLFTLRKCWVASAILGFLFLSYTQAFSTASFRAPTKAEKLGLGLSETPRGMTQKMLPPLEIKIQRIGPFEPGKDITYRAKVVSDFSSSQLKYQWELPEGLELVRGDKYGSLFEVKAFDVYMLEITARSLTDLNQQLHLYVTNTDPTNASTAMAQFNTVDQEEIDAAVKELHEKTKQASKKEALR